MRFRLRPARDSDIAMLFHWRNHPRVRAVMPFSGELEMDAHRQWWPSAMGDPQRRTMILEDRSTPMAVVVFLDLRPGCSSKWGFYTAPRSEIGRAGTLDAWRACEMAALAYAFHVLGLEMLYCETLSTHASALWMNEKAGFETVGQVYLARDQPPFVIQRLTRAAFQSGEQLGPDVDIEADPRDRHCSRQGTR